VSIVVSGRGRRGDRDEDVLTTVGVAVVNVGSVVGHRTTHFGQPGCRKWSSVPTLGQRSAQTTDQTPTAVDVEPAAHNLSQPASSGLSRTVARPGPVCQISSTVPRSAMTPGNRHGVTKSSKGSKGPATDAVAISSKTSTVEPLSPHTWAISGAVSRTSIGTHTPPSRPDRGRPRATPAGNHHHGDSVPGRTPWSTSPRATSWARSRSSAKVRLHPSNPKAGAFP